MNCTISNIRGIIPNIRKEINFKGIKPQEPDSFEISDSARQRQKIAKELKDAGIDEQSARKFLNSPEKVAKYTNAITPGEEWNEYIRREIKDGVDYEADITPLEAYTIADLDFSLEDSIYYIIGKEYEYPRWTSSPEEANNEAILCVQNKLQHLIAAMPDNYQSTRFIPSELIEYSKEKGLDHLQGFLAMKNNLSDAQIELFKKYAMAREEYKDCAPEDLSDMYTSEDDMEHAVCVYDEVISISNRDAEQEINRWMSTEQNEGGTLKSGLKRALTLQEAVEAKIRKLSVGELNELIEFENNHPGEYDFANELIWGGIPEEE